MNQLKELITDVFKILSLSVTNNHEIRREKIKKELDPKYKGICNKEASTTKLFEYQLQETIKSMGSSKFNLTLHQSSRKSFWGKKRGEIKVIPLTQQLQQLQRRQQQQQQQQASVPQPTGPEIQQKGTKKKDPRPVGNHFSWSCNNTSEKFYAGKTADHVNSWTRSLKTGGF